MFALPLFEGPRSHDATQCAGTNLKHAAVRLGAQDGAGPRMAIAPQRWPPSGMPSLAVTMPQLKLGGRPMMRREVITLLGIAAAWPRAARAQQAGKLPTIGLLGADASGWTPWTAAFVQRLRDLGWIEGRTVAIEYRWSEGSPERDAEIAAEFVRQKVDIIVTHGAAAPTVKQATSVIPIVFAIALDPVGVGLVTSLARPGGNVTGLSRQSTDLAAKRLEIMRELVPRLRRLAIMGT